MSQGKPILRVNGVQQGLGKTLQTVSFIGYLKFHQGIPGPHLIIVPKSTLDNWAREVAKWVPGFNVVVLQGTKEERAELIARRILTQDFDVLITSYEMCLREKSTLKRFSWEYIIIDEAHRIKNVDSLLSQIIRTFVSRGRLLITGTPLQNNLQELWALLNFILPDVFSSRCVFFSLLFITRYLATADKISVRTLMLGSRPRTKPIPMPLSSNSTKSSDPSCFDESKPMLSTLSYQRRRLIFMSV